MTFYLKYIIWQLTGLDLPQYKRLKFYIKANGSNATYLSPSIIVEMSLDNRSVSFLSNNCYASSNIHQYPNNANRLIISTFVVNSDKTAISFLIQNLLYGTSATSATGDGRYCYLIEVYYD